jgi:hypothetical protein
MNSSSITIKAKQYTLFIPTSVAVAQFLQILHKANILQKNNYIYEKCRMAEEIFRF